MSPALQISRVEKLFPMIKIFEVGSSYYMYDAKSGVLAGIDLKDLDDIYNYFQLNDSSSVSDHLKDLIDNNVFLPGPLKKVTPNQEELSDIIEYQIDGYIPRSASIEVTEKCNLACKYCFFYMEDGFENRHHQIL